MVDEKHKEIIAQSLEAYMRFGIKSMTMDDMARHLGVSKKTLYKYVSDKNDLVSQAMEFATNMEICAIDEISKNFDNAIDEIFEIHNFVLNRIRNLHPSIFYDLTKYHPEAWKKFGQMHMEDNVMSSIVNNLNKGLKQKLYRSDLNVNIIARIYMAKIQIMFDGSVFPQNEFPLDKVYLEMFRYHIRGIASEKGLEYLVSKVKQEKAK